MIDSELCPVCKTKKIECSVFTEAMPRAKIEDFRATMQMETRHCFMCMECAKRMCDMPYYEDHVYVYKKDVTPEIYNKRKAELFKTMTERVKRISEPLLKVDFSKLKLNFELSDELKDKYFIATSKDSELSKLLKNSIRDLTEALEDLKKGDTIAWAKTIDVLSELKKLDSISPDREMEFMGL